MTLYYDFNDGPEFEYEPSNDGLDDFFDSLSDERIAEGAEEIYDKSSASEQADILRVIEASDFVNKDEIITIDADNNKTINMLPLVKADKDWVISEIINFDIDEFEDEALDYFRSDAYEQYTDWELYSKDPYGYNGVKRSDFY